MGESHYSLRWNNHRNHLLSAFEALLHNETLVDVTLVCAEFSVRAHKVVLSACSSFFQKIFSENPCRHPVIVLKDFTGWEIQAIIDFMYKGEISVIQEQLQDLIKAAESLCIRGLAPEIDEEKISVMLNETPTPSTSPNDFDRTYYGRYHPNCATVRTGGERSSPFPLFPTYEPTPVKLPHMSRLNFPESLLPRPLSRASRPESRVPRECQSPVPRRKQARPRRRSGDMSGGVAERPQEPPKPSPQPPRSVEDQPAPENLCVRKPDCPKPREDDRKRTYEKTRTPDPSGSPEIDLTMPPKEFRASPPVSLPPTMNLKQEIENHSPLPFPPMPSVSALAMTPPHSKFFGLDSPLGLFNAGLDACRNPLFDMTDPRTTPDTHSQLYVKKKMGRPKGQHSAPRGGPPRSWTNAELTEALQHVWNKKMTTSQASRIFGIPYNSLLMYVRGKYGKSLKLEQLRKDCIGGPPAQMDLLAMGSNNNNNACNKNERDRDNEMIQPNTRPPSAEEQQQHQQPPPVFNPFAHSYFPDFGTGFPIPVSMIHLLPQTDKSREHYGAQQQAEDDCKGGGGVKKESEEEDMFRPPALSVDDRRELVQQNGQD